MARPLNVLFVSSEVDPFAKTGGLADVSSALPQALRSLDHEVRIMLPRYGVINERKAHLHEMLRLKEIEVPVGGKKYLAGVKSSFLTSTHAKVQVYFLDNQHFFGRHGLYVHPDTRKDYQDNDERFIFFCRGILEVLKRLGWAPDIIHCNDWMTGLLPAYLKTMYSDDPFYAGTKTVFTIHNMAYQGTFPATSFAKTLLPRDAFSPRGVEAFGKLNFLKAALVYADALTTVSEKYAAEISTSEEFGCGLQDLLRERKHDLTGILNGVDYSLWDPAVDELLPHRYDIRSIDLKVENKKALCARMGLPFQERTPVLGIISRLADQKGFDLIDEVFDDLLAMDLQIVVLGTGEKKYHDLFQKASHRKPDRIAAALMFNDELAHWIEAGADMFLMPSRYEPCGLNQIYSLRYGTIPVVRATGGLEDTIEDIDVAAGSGTGFKFKNYSGTDMLKAIRRAASAYADQTNWRKLMKNGMTKDFSWEGSARKYVQLYRSLAKK